MKVAEIVLVNFVLSGDNALVIAIATLRLPASQRRTAMAFGTALSIALRIGFTLVASRVLQFPYVQAFGGLLLVYLALSLILSDRPHSSGETFKLRSTRLAGAVLSIAFADVAMSLDNILALGGIAGGNEQLLIIGLIISISLIMFASSVIAAMLSRFRSLIVLGAGVLAWTAGGMMARDPAVSQWLGAAPYIPVVAAMVAVALSYGLTVAFRWNA